ncbi:hypothetical protein ANN_02255 [Periplaneta americana]|uniref:Uncharacterized protein n=1 Tax=Periplaneta americana TaxID=6978 RepID=A0ABQ8TZZ6_PERAM|nr:hypothetical protein ANN_02255 [Periplaneta americana]
MTSINVPQRINKSVYFFLLRRRSGRVGVLTCYGTKIVLQWLKEGKLVINKISQLGPMDPSTNSSQSLTFVQCRQELNQTYYNENIAVPNNFPWNTLTPAASLDLLGSVVGCCSLLCRTLGKIMEVIDSTDSSAVAAVKSLLSEQLSEYILFIDSNFKIVSKSIILLESSKLQLSEALNIVYKISQTVIQNNNSLISEKMKCKLRNIIAKNSAYSQLRTINYVLSGHDKTSEVGVLKSSDFLFFKYVCITSCDVECTFSQNKNCLSDHRRRLLCNRSKYM